MDIPSLAGEVILRAIRSSATAMKSSYARFLYKNGRYEQFKQTVAMRSQQHERTTYCIIFYTSAMYITSQTAAVHIPVFAQSSLVPGRTELPTSSDVGHHIAGVSLLLFLLSGG